MLVQRNAKSRMVKKCTETSTKISRNVSSTCRWYKLNYYQLQLQPVYRHVETPLKGTVTSRVSGIRTVCTEVRCQLPSTKNNNNCCGLICTGRKEWSRLKFTSFHLFGKGMMFYLAVCVYVCVRAHINGRANVPKWGHQNASQHHQEQASAIISTKETSKTAKRLNVNYVSSNPIVTVWTPPPLAFHSGIILTRYNSWIGSSLEIADQRAGTIKQPT